METTVVGKVVVHVKMENLEDLFEVRKGLRSPDEVRTVEVPDALVDTGATMLSVPKRFIDQLGLFKVRNRHAVTATGHAEFGVYSPVQLTIQGRECFLDVAELPDECPILIGQFPLEHLDFVVDPVGQRLIGNPEHGGKHMIEMY